VANFQTAEGEQFTVEKQCGVSQTKTDVKYKTYESRLVLAGLQRTTRKEDLENELPQMLGVSPAILESVTFCHQEDSTWPMSDGKALKERFDAIFASTQYAKALDEVIKQCKELRLRVKEAEMAYSAADEHRRQGHRKLAALNHQKQQVNQRQVELAELKAKADRAIAQADAVRAHLSQVQALRERYEKLQGSVEHQQRDLAEARKQLELDCVRFNSVHANQQTGSAETQAFDVSALLQLDEASLHHRISSLEASLIDLEADVKEMQRNEKSAEERYTVAQQDLGNAENRVAVENEVRELYRVDASKLKEFVAELQQRHGLDVVRSYNKAFDPCDPVQRNAVREALNKLLTGCRETELKVLEDLKAKEEALQAEQTTATTLVATKQALVEQSAVGLDESQRRLNECYSKIRSLLATFITQVPSAPSEAEQALEDVASKPFELLANPVIAELQTRLNTCREERQKREEDAAVHSTRFQGLVQVRKLVRERSAEMEGLNEFIRLRSGKLRLYLQSFSDLNKVLEAVAEGSRISDSVRTLVESVFLTFLNEATALNEQLNAVLSSDVTSSTTSSVETDFQLWKEIASRCSIDSINSLLNRIVPEVERLQTDLSKLREGLLAAELHERSRAAQLHGEIATVKRRLDELSSALQKSSEEMSSYTDQLRNALPNLFDSDPRVQKLEDLDLIRNKLTSHQEETLGSQAKVKQNRLQREAIIDLYRDYANKAKHTETCPLCDRGFNSADDELKKFIATLDAYTQSLISVNAGASDGVDKENPHMSDLEEKYTQQLIQIQECLQLVELIKECSKESAELQEEEKTLAERLSGLESEVQAIETNPKSPVVNQLVQMEQHLMRLSSMVPGLVNESKDFAFDVTRFKALAESFERTIQRALETGLPMDESSFVGLTQEEVRSWTGAAQFVELAAACAEVEAEIEKTSTALSDTRNQCNNLDRAVVMLTDELNRHQQTESKRQEDWNKLRQYQTDILPEVRKMLSEAQRANTEATTALQSAEDACQIASNKLLELRMEIDENRTYLRDVASKVQRDFDRFVEFCERLLERERKMSVSWDAANAELKAAQSSFSLAQQDYEIAMTRAKSAARALELAKEKISIARQALKIREDEGRYAATLDEQSKIQAQLRTLGATEVDTNLELEAQRAREEYARASGALEQLIDQMSRDQMELEVHYSDAELRYRQAKTTLGALNLMAMDLHKYSKALDAALMRFHSMKLEDVNEILRDSWRETYQGTDIDEIFIKSETDNSASTVLANSDDNNLLSLGDIKPTRRSFNYRVVMKKNGREIDMKGRCSMGQKVLASLLIRLALAEAFSVRCGMLALDEPTTNLDSYNSRAFAEALSTIIAHRRRSSNFQLILITHDYEFVKMIGGKAHCDYYYEVSKDSNQYSVITKKSMA